MNSHSSPFPSRRFYSLRFQGRSTFSLFTRCSSLFAIAFFGIAITAPAQEDKTPAQVRETPAQPDEAPYFGDWENDRGDTLQIANDSIKLNNEKPIRYDDITEDSDETFFVLQIKEPTELSYFGGNFLRIAFGKDPDHFTMSVYKALPDALKQQNEVKRIEWSTPAEEKEETEPTDQPNEEKPREEQKSDGETQGDQPQDDQAPDKGAASPTAAPSPSAP